MELKFKRKLSTNKFGYIYLNVPAEIAKALACEYVNLIWKDGGVLMVPVG
jgi:hypothetical protein